MMYYIPCELKGKQGYVVLIADSEIEAEQAFRVLHPDYRYAVYAVAASGPEAQYIVDTLGGKRPVTHARDILKAKGKAIEIN